MTTSFNLPEESKLPLLCTSRVIEDLSMYWYLTLDDVNLQPLLANTPYHVLENSFSLRAESFPRLMTQLQERYNSDDVIRDFILFHISKISAALETRKPLDLRRVVIPLNLEKNTHCFLRLTKRLTYNLFLQFFVEDTVSWTFEYIEIEGKSDP